MFTEVDYNRLSKEKNIWLASVRNNNKPHLIPIWFVLYNNHLFLCTISTSIKIKNISKNKYVIFSLENGDDPLIVEGEALVKYKPYNNEIIQLYKDKYDWDIENDKEYDCLVEIIPERILFRKKF